MEWPFTVMSGLGQSLQKAPDSLYSFNEFIHVPVIFTGTDVLLGDNQHVFSWSSDFALRLMNKYDALYKH